MTPADNWIDSFFTTPTAAIPSDDSESVEYVEWYWKHCKVPVAPNTKQLIHQWSEHCRSMEMALQSRGWAPSTIRGRRLMAQVRSRDFHAEKQLAIVTEGKGGVILSIPMSGLR